MSDFLKSLKSDLTDRRLLPLVVLAAVALLGALGYALLGGGGSSTPTASTAPPTTSGPTGVAVSEVQSTSKQAVAETTGGTADQHHGVARDPFVGLPTAIAKAASTSSSTTSSSTATTSSSSSSSKSSSSGSSSSGSEKSSGGSPSGGSNPKPKPVYKVAVLFGELPAGTTPQNAQLKAYTGLIGSTPLPNSKQTVVRYLGTLVTSKGPRASFEVVGEAIIHGEGTCLPSAAQCKVIDLPEGKTEQLQTILSSGQPVTWELRVVSIESASASAASVASVLHGQAKEAGSLEGRDGALWLAGLRFSSRAGTLVFRPAAHAARAHGARAHVALAHHAR